MGKIIRNGINYGGTYEDATSVNYDGTASGLEARTVQEAVDEVQGNVDALSDSLVNINKSLGVGVIIDVTTLPLASLASAIAHMCDNYMTTNNTSYNGRFKYSECWYSYNAYYSYGQWTGFVTSSKNSNNETYSFYRGIDKDAVLSKLNESLEWKFLGSAQASTAFSSDFTQYKELSLRCALSGYGSMYMTIPTISLSSTAIYCAPIDTAVNGKLSKLGLQITNSSISIFTAYDEGNDVISSSRIYVYAR